MDFSNVDFHIGRRMLNNMKINGNKTHQIEIPADIIETHDSVRFRSIRVAEVMKKRGMQVGDLVVVCGLMHNDVSIPIIASLCIGCPVLPLSVTMTHAEVKNFLKLSKPGIIFCDSSIKEIFAKVVSELNYDSEIVIFENTPSENFTSFSDFLKPTGTEEEFKVTEFDPAKTTAFILCSSGTTGLPKGVCHTHRTFLIGMASLIMVKNKEFENGIYLNFSTTYWVSGIVSILISCVTGVTRINCSTSYSVDILEKGLKHKPTTLFLSPVNLYELIKHPKFDEMDFSSLNAMFVGASPTSPETIEIIKKKIKTRAVVNGYGMTEIGSISVNFSEKLDSIGKINPWLEWRVVNPDTDKKVGPGTEGELRLKSEGLFSNYFKNPKATSESYDSEGWFRTGDLVSYDEEGFIYFRDRLKEVIKYRSFQVSPAEVEFEIMKLSGVLMAAVVGKTCPEDGERPMAFVQKIEGSDITAQEIQDAVKNTLSDSKHLRGGVIFLESLPQTVSGKVNRKTLKAIALSWTENSKTQE